MYMIDSLDTLPYYELFNNDSQLVYESWLRYKSYVLYSDLRQSEGQRSS